MLYVTALLASPLAVWLCAGPGRACLNVTLWALALVLLTYGFVPGLLIPIIDAAIVVRDYYVDRRLEHMVQLVRVRSARV